MASNPEDDLPPVNNRRENRRQRVVVGGLIVSRDGVQTWDCLVRDLSGTGAKIKVSQSVVIPEHCHFVQLKDGIAFDAIVQWIRLPEIGLKISDPVSLKETTDAKYKHLRGLWMERRNRGSG